MAERKIVGSAYTTEAINDKSAYQDVRQLNIWDFMKYTFDGTQGFRDGTYLIPHPREMFYNHRRKISFYKNFFRPIIASMVDPLFTTEIKRESNDAAFDVFLGNVDNVGTTMQEFVKDVMYAARIYGVTFVVMDSPDNVPPTQYEATISRELPYIYRRDPQDVEAWECDKWGALKTITFHVGYVMREKNRIEQFMKYDENNWWLMEKVGAQWVIVKTGVHGLGRLPVMPITSFVLSNSLQDLPDPPLFSLAWLCFVKYNIDSEIRIVSQMQTFSILVGQFGGTNVTIGPSNFLDIPLDAKITPSFIGPDPTHFTNMQAYAGDIVNEIHALANQLGVIGVKSEASGIAKEWDFRAEEMVLKDTSKSAHDLEMWIAEMYEEYTGVVTDYTAMYPTEFAPNWADIRTAQIFTALDKMPTLEVQRELWKEFVAIFWKGDSEKRDFIIESMDNVEPVPEPVASSEQESSEESSE